MKKKINFIVEVKFDVENNKCLEELIQDILKEGIWIGASGCGENGCYDYEATKTKLLKERKK